MGGGFKGGLSGEAAFRKIRKFKKSKKTQKIRKTKIYGPKIIKNF
jgi:hypothetical protein